MIEPDIEDRMTRISMGAVGGNPIDPDVATILNKPTTDTGLAVPQEVGTQGIDPDVADIVSRDNPIPLMSSLMSARRVDPAQAAQAQNLAAQLGIGQDLALRNMGQAADRAFMAEINRRDIANANPAVANLLARRDFANLAHNDIDNLVESDRFWKQASGQSAISDSWWNQAVDWMTPDVVKASLATGYARAAAQDEIKPLATAVYKRLLSGGTAAGLSDSEEAQLRVRYRELNALQQSISGLESKASGWLTEPTYFASQMAMSLPNVARYAEMGAVAGGAIGAVGGVGILDWATIPVGLAVGGAMGATTGFFMDSFESNAGEIYFQLRDKGYSRDQSYYTALTSGALIAAIDVGALKLASRFTGTAVSKAFGNAVVTKTMERFGLRATEQAVMETTAEAAKRTLGRAVTETGLEAAKATLAEAGGETLQDMVQYAAEVAAYNMTPAEMQKALQSPESLSEAASGWVDTFLKTAQGTWVFQIPGMAAHITHARKQLRQAQRSAALIDRVASLSASSKLKQTSPQAYETAIETLAQNSGAETIYVDGATARNMLMQANISGEQLDAIVPGLATQISEAAELGADVQIPIAKFAANMAGTPIDAALRPHMRLSPSERTATEMQFESQLVRAMVDETEEASALKVAKTREFAESASKVEQRVYADLWNSGRFSRENARTNAVLAKRFYATMASRMGMTPGQLYEQLPYTTVRESAELPAPVSAMAMTALTPEQGETLSASVDSVEKELRAGGYTNVSEDRFGFFEDRVAAIRTAIENNNVRDLASEAAIIREDIQKNGPNPPMERLAADVESRVAESTRTTPNILEQASRIDADYLAAVESGDMDAAQRMVDKTATKAGYTFGPVYHGGATKIDVPRGIRGVAASATLNKTTAQFYAEAMDKAIKEGNAILPEGARVIGPTISRWMIRGELFDPTNPEHIKRAGLQDRKDLQFVWEDYEMGFEGGLSNVAKAVKNAGFEGYLERENPNYPFKNVVIFEPQNIKSADPVTYDESGAVIPLSRRFDITSPRIFEQAARPEAQNLTLADVEQVFAELGVEHRLNESATAIRPGIIRVPKELRDEGRATKAMQQLIAYADQSGKRIDISPTDEFGSNKNRLVNWYKRLGFVENKGRNKDFSISATMYRVPRIPKRLITPSFYSALERELTAIDAKAMAASGWKERIKGLVGKGAIKSDELEWTGLLDWIDMQEGKVSKDTVLKFVRSNGVQVERRAPTARKYEQYTLLGSTNYREVLLTLPAGFQAPAPSVSREGLAAREAIFAKYAPRLAELEREYTSLMFAGRALTSAEAQRLADVGNERDEVEEHRNAEARAAYKIPERPTAPEYRTTHWDQPNVLVHLRMNDRVDADGKRVLFVEEVQSDWGQAGRKKGFAGAMRPATEEDVRSIMHDVFGREEGDNITDIYGWDTLATVVNDPANAGDLIVDAGWSEQQTDRFLQLARDRKVGVGVPRAPFVETTDGWLNLSLKQVMLEAINGGYDRVAFVNGKQSADRYSLAEQIDSIVYRKNADGTFDFDAIKDSSVPLGRKNQTLDDVEAALGKEIAQSFANGIGQETEDYGAEYRELTGIQLEVGGEGMKEFYDSIVPAAMNKLLKKYGGGKIGTVEIDTRTPESEAYYEEPTDADILPQPGFAITPEMLKKMESGLPLFQATPEAPRGYFDPSRLTTILTEKSDLSTWLHETGHFFLTAISQMAMQPNATAEIRSDMDEVLKWYGIAGETPEQRLATWNAMPLNAQRKYHEQWAYNFEIYLSERKAPSVELQGVFDRFAAWLRGVYKSIRDELNAVYRREFGSDLPILTTEVRQVMDRMLASEEQIKLAREVNMAKALFTGKPEGMSDEEWAAYQSMAEEDENEAIASMTQASLKSMEWLSGARSRLLKELQVKHDKTRREVRDRLTKQAKAEPVYRALEFFRTGKLENPDGTVVVSERGYRLNKAGVQAIVDAQSAMTGPPGREVMLPTFIDPLKLPKGIMAEDGMDPAMASEMLGFRSANEMLLSIANAKPLAEEVNARTDAEMVRTHSELATPEGREKEIQKALHVETRERMIGVELRFLAKATQPVRVFIEAAKRAAQEILSGRLVKDVTPSEFVAAEARAAREAGMSLESLPTAQEASQRAYKAEYGKQIAQGADAATADVRASGAARKAETEAQQRIDQLKAKYGDATPDQITIRATRQRLLQNQLAKLAISVRDEIDDGVRYLRKVMRDKNVKAMGAEAADQIAALLVAVDIRPMTQKEANRRAALTSWIQKQLDLGIEPDIDDELQDIAFKTPYKNLTVDQFRNLISAIEQIEYIGKNENKIRTAKRKAEFQAELDVINNNIRANYPKRKVLAREANTPAKERGKKIVRFHASMLTGQTIVRILDGGRDGGPLWNLLVRPFNEAGDRRTELTADATRKLTAILKPFLSTGAMTGQTLEFPGINRGLTLENRMVLALNMGNAGNIQRTLDGEGWTMDTIRPVLESLTEEQWNAVQEVWDYLETFRPLFAERERRLIGREPQWVEAQPLTTKTADGKEITLKGGYYPAKYDLDANQMSENLDAQQQAQQQMGAARMTPATQNGGLKKRAKQVKNRPVTLKLSALYSRVDEMIHDLCYREAVIDANRLMNSSFNTTVRETFGPEYARALKNYVADVAAGERVPQDDLDVLLNFIRRGKSAAALGLNIWNSIQNTTGIANSWERIGGKWLLNGVLQFAAHPLTQIERVYEMSSLMRNRGRTSLMNLNEIRNMVEGQSSTMRQLEIATYFLQQQTQRVVDMCTWLGQYTKGLAEGHDEEQAIAMADQSVIDAQGSGMVKDLPSIMRGAGKKKILSMFYGFFNTTYNLLAAKHMTSKNAGEIAATYFRVIIVPATLSYILKQLLTPTIDDDDKDIEQIAKELAAENLGYLMNTVIGVRELAQLSKTVFDADNRPISYGGPVAFSSIGDLYRFAQQAKQFEFDGAFRRSMLNLIGWGTGLPTSQMNRTIDGITALYEGETTSPLAPVFGVRKQ